MNLDLARVIGVNPESHSIDLELMNDGRRMAGVKVMASLAGTDFGSSGFAPPENEGYGSKKSKSREIIAVLSWVNGLPLVLGFIFPEVAQCLFKEKGRTVYRHPSDAYITIDSKGNAEFYHPSGAFIRMGESGAHEDLTGKDYDGKWSIKRNTGRKVNIHVEQGGGTASINIAPDGAISVKTVSTFTMESDAEATIKAPHVTVDTPEAKFTGNVVAVGTITDLSDSSGRSMDSMRQVFNDHTHDDPQGGKVQPPAAEM